ncbi:hypothetical protein DYI22_01255 [Marinobacter lipolyticus]|uniref:hypothetical protein n=1 Tax=Marinobacter lipolyticus TaxID=209639 RepID=UPI001BCFEE16|nr:hypothetical protein [Marinobacter lipolyticus]MBS8239128.1 hypothetical protein [Marinobacter lipolyticus]
MTNEELLEFLWDRYQSNGIASLSYPEIKKEKGLYFHIYKKGFKLKEVISLLGLEKEYEEYKNQNFTKQVDGKIQQRWTWDRVIKEASGVQSQMGFLPPAAWFQQNGKGSLVHSIYNKFNKTWDDLRKVLDCYETSNFVESRNGMRWLSHPEASLSNFLYARGVEHKKGERYPDSYSEYGDASYGYYDLHFRTFDGRWIDVEIWGDKPNGHAEKRYGIVREAKETFNSNNPNFLGIQHRDCFDEQKLENHLKPYIGCIEPFVFDKPTDEVIQTTHWSNADELIAYCKTIAAEQSDGLFPTEEWLRKRGKWKDRKGETYNTVSIYIKTWIGGIRKLRQILEQEEGSTIQWDRETALKAYKDYYDQYGIVPGQAKRLREGVTREMQKKSGQILGALNNHYGTAAKANDELGIVIDRAKKWSGKRLIEEATTLFQRYGLTPAQINNLNPEDKVLFGVSDAEKDIAGKIVAMVGTYFGSSKKFYCACGFEPTDLRLVRRQSKSAATTE